MEGGEKERRSRSVSIPQAVSTIAIKFYRKNRRQFLVSIPQAVSTIAMRDSFISTELTSVSIPQAVSTIAIKELKANGYHIIVSFNTASGKYYCNTA